MLKCVSFTSLLHCCASVDVPSPGLFRFLKRDVLCERESERKRVQTRWRTCGFRCDIDQGRVVCKHTGARAHTASCLRSDFSVCFSIIKETSKTDSGGENGSIFFPQQRACLNLIKDARSSRYKIQEIIQAKRIMKPVEDGDQSRTVKTF